MSKKILIVEDEKPMANALKMKLTGTGFDAKAVYNGKQALAELKNDAYDLILLDLMMPEMGGFEMLEKMKEAGIKVPVIVSTNLSQESDIAKAKELGAVDYFVKSDTPVSQVVEHVQKALK